MNRRIPDILIEQAALGELPPQKIEELRRECDLDARIADLENSNRQILDRYTPQAMAAAINRRGSSNAPSSRIIQGVFRLALPLAAAAALFIAVGLPSIRNGQVVPDDAGALGIRLKGMQPALKVYRQSGSSAEELKNRQEVQANDLLQVSYIAADAQYGVILSIDGSGSITLHYPDYPQGDQRLAAGGEFALPFSYQLDNAPRFERFYFISGAKEIPMNLLMEEAERVAMSRTGLWAESFHLPDGYRQTSLLLLKGK